jgi:hypothetical protein
MALLALASFWATASTVAQGPTATAAVDAHSHLTEPRTEDGSQEAPVLWLRGPFGKVAGGTRGDPATTPPGGGPLDMAYQRMPLSLEADDPGLLSGIRVTSELVETGQRETLAQGQPVFEGPALPGVQLVIASLSRGGTVVELAWLVDVPERELPEDGLVIDIPAPGVIVSTESGQQVGVMADGCYAFLCVETGPPPPASTLAALVTRVGETPVLSIGDGSALVAWQGRLSPLGGTQETAREATGAITDTPTVIVPLDGLEPPARGDWLLEVRVEFDRERGWAWYDYRLIAE